ncbi:ATP-binding protein [Streptomyces sp. YU58]|uniref:ATP-binding protein n=1 Tax=Streptomyces sp. SX92 TaxID=3158972 RepID=UPI0027BA81DE|nr:ATP-binding protein [Streptomyces coralus]WLW52711.1 ATP-binding protein [Streptomyces coralus]
MIRFRFVDEHRHAHGVKRMCDVLGWDRSGYYTWHKNKVTNAYRYATGPATLSLCGLARGRLRLSVGDTNPHIPPPFDKRSGPVCAVPGEADGGRGLLLVCHYADAWGGYPLGDDLFGRGGKLLWCEVGVSSACGSGAVAA